MTLFRKQESTSAYLKAGLMGFAGGGKTFTATQIAIGLHAYLKERKLPEGDAPVFFLDTETGSDYVRPLFDKAGIELEQAKTRAFVDLVPAVREAESRRAILLIDSISHFWREFTESYAQKRNRHRGLEFSDWAYLKKEWGKFTDAYVNSASHIIMCGRAGYEFDFFEDENGKKQLEKTGVKMRAETETGYEPSLLVLLERHMDMDTKRVYREAHVLKERFDVIDGKTFRNPKFEDFLPHIELLNLGGAQVGVDTSRSSEESIPGPERQDWKWREKQCEILLEKIEVVLKEQFNTATKDGRNELVKALMEVAGTESWKELETFHMDKLKEVYKAAHIKFRGVDPYAVPEVPANEPTVERTPEAA